MDARLGDESMERTNRSEPGLLSATLLLLVPAAEDLYPAVTLHSPASVDTHHGPLPAVPAH
jgi:hypothetical protein